MNREIKTASAGPDRRWRVPETRVGRLVLFVAVLVLACAALRILFGRGTVGSFFGSWIGIGLFALIPLALILLVRSVSRSLLWKVRNRLIVTYALMGLAPVVLFVTLAAIAIYVFAGQFSINSALSGLNDVNVEVKSEASAVAELLNLPEVRRDPGPIHFEQTDNTHEGQISAAQLQDGTWRNVPLLTSHGVSPVSPFDGSPTPGWLHSGYKGMVVRHSHLYLCQFSRNAQNDRSASVLACLPINPSTLSSVAHSLGRVLLFSGYPGEHPHEIDNAEREAQTAEQEADLAEARQAMQERLRDAEQQRREAQQAMQERLREAQQDQREGQQQIQEAMRQVQRAQAEAARAIRSGSAEDHDDAEEGVRDAQQELSEAEKEMRALPVPGVPAAPKMPAPPAFPAKPATTLPRSKSQAAVGSHAGNTRVPAGKANKPSPANASASPAGTTEDHSFTAVSGGTLPEGRLLDPRVYFTAPLSVSSWQDGVQAPAMLVVISRPSALYARLFANSVEMGSLLRNVLIGLAIGFGCIELLALWMAFRLSGTITRSVADLYLGTTQIDQGNLEYRVRPQRQDQLGALAGSFNRMAGSIQDLLVQQHEKDRLLNELAIAQEVQQNLFPHSPVSISGLELHAICLPARSVSGDYFDFILGHNTFGKGTGACVALGDISGKGISAALLMATLHSAVRAFSLREDLAMPSPAQQLELLNKHLFGSTQSNRYATLFLAFYDAQTRRLTYSNGGHLPPFLISANGTVRRLDVGGPVVGLLEGLAYEEATVEMQPGDLLAAFTDGLTEPENSNGKEFGEGHLLKLLRHQNGVPLPLLADSVFDALGAWISGQEQPDDMTLLLARLR